MSQIDIIIIDEFEDLTQKGAGVLDLETGVISNIVRDKNHHSKPWKAKDYEFTSGILKLGNTELEFAIQVNKKEEYQVSNNELNEINGKLVQMATSKTKRTAKPR